LSLPSLVLPPPSPPLFPYTTLFRSLACADSSNSRESTLKRTPSVFARASTNQNPALCRVLSYWGPGLPSPTIRRRPSLPVTRRRSEEHTSELQSRENLVCRLLLEKK